MTTATTRHQATVADLYRVPTIYHRRGKVAEAEPSVPGWRMAVDELFAWVGGSSVRV